MRIMPCIVVKIHSDCSTQTVGTTAGGITSPASTMNWMISPTLPRRRCQMQAVIDANSTMKVTDTTVSTVELMNVTTRSSS